MERTTLKQLWSLVDDLNRVTGNPMATYSRQAGGTINANPGNYHLDEAYGKFNLAQISNTGGSIHHPIGIGFYTKRELADKIRAYLYGLRERKVPA
jgi:hypothetical protein